jgi:hypothetical protein
MMTSTGAPRGAIQTLGVSKAPNLFLVGAPKCGTSALAHYLSQHPNVFMAPKEMHFFGGDLRFGPGFYRRDEEAYLAEFDARHGRRWAGEASVWYLFSTLAASEIYDFNPQARILIMLRNPVETIHSMYYQFRFDGNENLPTFEEALAAEPERRAGCRIPRQCYFPQGLAYRQVARYAGQIGRYLEVFGRDRVHVILYDDFAVDTAATYQGALDFLGLQPSPRQSEFGILNGNKRPKSVALQAVLNAPWLRATAVGMRSWLPRPAFAAVRRVGIRACELNSSPVKRPALSAQLRSQLIREFAPDVERLSDLLGRDLREWTQ